MTTERKRFGAGTWLTLLVLGVMLALAIFVGYVGWATSDSSDPAQGMTTSGYIAMALGILATLALGIGLMALIFYSNRAGRD